MEPNQSRFSTVIRKIQIKELVLAPPSHQAPQPSGFEPAAAKPGSPGPKCCQYVAVREQRRDLLCQLLLRVSAELQKAHQHGRDVHVGLPDGEAAADEVDGGSADGAVCGQLGAGRLQQQERQRLACGQSGRERHCEESWLRLVSKHSLSRGETGSDTTRSRLPITEKVRRLLWDMLMWGGLETSAPLAALRSASCCPQEV